MRNALSNFLVASLIVVAFSILGSAQTKSQSDSENIIVGRSRMEIVLLDVQVTNKRTGEIIDNLRHTDFEIFEDGIAQQILMMNVGYRPPSVVFLIDVNLDAVKRDEKFAEHFAKAVQSFGIDSEIAIIGLQEGSTLPLQQFMSDSERLSERLDSLKKNIPKNIHKDSINEMIQSGVMQMKKASDGMGSKVLIVITGEQSTLVRNNVTLQALYGTNYVVYGMIVSNKDDGLRTSSALSLYAENTGGEIVSTSPVNLTEQLNQMASRIRMRYLLGYEPTNEKRDGKFRYVRVSLTPQKKKELGDVIIKTRLGFYAPTFDEK